MKNDVYSCNLEEEIFKIHNEVDKSCVNSYVSKHAFNHPYYIKENAVEIEVENHKPSKTFIFAHPHGKVDKSVMKIPVPKTKNTANKTICYVNHQIEQFCYTFDNNNMRLFEEQNVFVPQVKKPRKKTTRQGKSLKRNQVANLIKWEDLCYQPEFEAEYHCNLKPNNYGQYLNDPGSDPMFCQFDVDSNRQGDFSHDVEMDWQKTHLS